MLEGIERLLGDPAMTVYLGGLVLRRFGTAPPPPPPGVESFLGNHLSGRALRWGLAGCAVVFVAAIGTLIYLFVTRRQSRYALLGLLLGIGLGSLVNGLCFSG